MILGVASDPAEGDVGRGVGRPPLPPFRHARALRRLLGFPPAAGEEPRARFALEVFYYRAASEIGSLAAALGGLDGIVFTAGIGENAVPVRSAIGRACAWLGVELDEEANQRNQTRISTPKSRVGAYMIKTDENLMIARHVRALVGG